MEISFPVLFVVAVVLIDSFFSCSMAPLNAVFLLDALFLLLAVESAFSRRRLLDEYAPLDSQFQGLDPLLASAVVFAVVAGRKVEEERARARLVVLTAI